MTPQVDYDAEWYERWKVEAERCVRLRVPAHLDRDSAVAEAMVGVWRAYEEYDGRGRLEDYVRQRLSWSVMGWLKLKSNTSESKNGEKLVYGALFDESVETVPAAELDEWSHDDEIRELCQAARKHYADHDPLYLTVIDVVIEQGRTQADAAEMTGVTNEWIRQVRNRIFDWMADYAKSRGRYFARSQHR